jgi:MFS family permease
VTDGRLGRRFWTLWSAFSTSNLGDGLTLVGFPLLAVTLTDDARLVTLVAAFRFLPFFVIGLPAGVMIDRLDRRRIAMVAQVLRGAALVGIAVAVLAGSASIAMLALGAFVVGVGEVLIDGGLPAVVRDIVASDNLETANSRMRASETVSNMFIGPPLGALMFRIDAAIPFLAAAGLYLVSVGFLSQLRGSFAAEPDPTEGSFIEQMKKGLVYVWQHPVLRPLALAVAAFSFVGEASNAVLVILATERLGLSEIQYGLLLTVDAMASVVMSFLVTGLVRRTSHGSSMKLSVVAFSAQAFIFGFATFIPFIIIGIALGGVSDPTWNVISATVRQRLVDDHIFGRMMTAYLFIAWSFQPVGAMVGGVIAESFGPEWVYVMAGTVVGSLLILARPLFRLVDEAMAKAD